MRLNLNNNRNAVRKTFLTVGIGSSCGTNWRFCIKEEKEGERSPMKNSDESYIGKRPMLYGNFHNVRYGTCMDFSWNLVKWVLIFRNNCICLYHGKCHVKSKNSAEVHTIEFGKSI